MVHLLVNPRADDTWLVHSAAGGVGSALVQLGIVWCLERFSDGRLKPLPVETFDLTDAGKAQARIESGKTVGKIVLVPKL